MLSAITHEVVAEEILKEQLLRRDFGEALPVSQAMANPKAKDKQIILRFVMNTGNGKDIFGSDKVSDSSVYFVCDNCGRNIAGSRFAAHINRCLGGRNKGN